MKAKYILIAAFFLTCTVNADTTGLGKIIFTQGHSAPACRTVKHKENGTGIERYFRIADVQGHDDVGGVVLAALAANRDVTITYDVTQTSGCGSEPKIQYVTIY